MSKRFKTRKLYGPLAGPKSMLSKQLRQASATLGKRERNKALQLLAASTRLARTDVQRAKIANLVAKSQFELGRYEDAAKRYAKAARLGANSGLEPQHFLRPYIGLIRCLLKDQKLDEAMSAALSFNELVAEKITVYNELIDSTLNQGPNGIIIPPKPLHPTAAFTRTGATFLQEGYLDTGKYFLQLATIQSPKGASRARQHLAETCFVEGQFDKAEQFAKESILFGKFKAKTIPSWRTLIRARNASRKPLLDESLYEEFQNIVLTKRKNPTRVKSRTDLTIISELRRYDDDQWLTLAHPWIKKRKDQDPIVRVEILKMILAELKSGSLETDTPAEDAMELAFKIYREPTLSAKECVALAKTLGKFGLASGLTEKQIERHLLRMQQRYSINYGYRARHACAIGLMEDAKFDSSRKIFQSIIQSSPEGSEHWAKAVWTLADLEASVGNSDATANLYFIYTSQPDLEPSLRLQAFLRWIRFKEQSGEEIDLAEVIEQTEALLKDIKGYRPLLDAGRQLALAGNRFSLILDRVSQKAERRAMREFDKASTTQEALVIILALTRRLYYDFRKADHVLNIYNGLTEKKLNWLWSQDSRYWEYLSLVIRSFFRSGKYREGEDMAKLVLFDVATPVVGQVFVGTHYAGWLYDQKRFTDAKAVYSRMVEQSPGHRLVSLAYYRMALFAYIDGKPMIAAELLKRGRKCLLPRPTFLSEWETDSKSGLMLKRIFADSLDVDLTFYSEGFLEKESDNLRKDLHFAGVRV